VADIIIDDSVSSITTTAFRNQVWKDASNGYQFFINSDGAFRYLKSTDGGGTWGSPVAVGIISTNLAYDVWYDRWTPGDSGNIIHIAFFDSSNDNVYYKSLDVSTDTISSETTVFDGSTALTDLGTHCSITKAVGGNLYIVFDLDAGAETGFYRSTDSGSSWTSRSNPVEAQDDWALLLPAANTGDTEDCLAIYFDNDADSLTLKWYDDSGNTWTESSSIATVVEGGGSVIRYPFAASIRHSDGKLICAVVTERDTSTSDHRVFELDRTAGAFAITELTAITTNIDDHYHVSVFINQVNDDIYVAYSGKRDGSETLIQTGTSEVYYTLSTDDGTTWSAGDTAYSESTASNGTLHTWTSLMGNRFYVSYTRNLTELEGNAVNSIAFNSGTEALLTSVTTGSAGTAAPVFSVAL
jgi:hypothetical protein